MRLTPSEFKVLALLAREPDRVFSRWQIMEDLWDAPYVGTARAADVHVSNLRRKIEHDPATPERLVTVREAGYKLVAGDANPRGTRPTARDACEHPLTRV